MTTNYTLKDMLDFLNHAGDKGLMPAASAQALAVATRNVFAVLEEAEQENLAAIDLDAIIRRFNNKRARDFSPSSLKEYGRRVQKARDLFVQWKNAPADFSVKTRAPRKPRKNLDSQSNAQTTTDFDVLVNQTRTGSFQSSFPVGPGRVVTISNVPDDLTSTEAERLAQFVRMLAVE